MCALLGNSPLCPCGQYTIATMPTDHACSDGTGRIVGTGRFVRQAFRNVELALWLNYRLPPAPREREQRRRWLEDHSRKYAGRRT